VRLPVALALSLVLGGCSGNAPTTSPAPTSPTVAVPIRAETVQGRYRLSFELPRSTWKAGEPIDGVATLALVNGPGVDLGGSAGGLFVFDFAAVDGSHHVQPGADAACAPYRLEQERPMSSSIKKSGGFSPDEPDAPFYRAFFRDPIVRLPAGEWRITAIVWFVEGRGCAGQSRTIQVPLTAHIVA
jgi:hypothetical protein